MKPKRYVFGGMLLLWVAATTRLEGREVMSWVPPYALDACKTVLQSAYGAFSPSNALTRLGLQFWIPTPTGTVVRTTEFDVISDSDVSWFKNWGASNEIEVLLCVYNNVSNVWNWSLAQTALIDHRSAFVNNLVTTMEHHDLDGIDIDLEGVVTPIESDRLAFKAFLTELSAELQSRGKTLTVDSFHSPLYNVPNMSWWADWTGLVQTVHSMGYSDLYEGSTDTFWEVEGYPFRYGWQQKYGVMAGLDPEAISMGLPGWTADWGSGGRGSNVLDHLYECIYDCAYPASVCIWDIQLEGSEGATNWRSPIVWETLARMAAYESTPPDPDHDGLPENWKIKFFGGTNAVDGGAADDRDKDGHSNLQEYIAGTDPTDKTSVFALSIDPADTGRVAIEFWIAGVPVFDPCYGDARRYYRLEHSSNLTTGAWQSLPGQTNILGNDRMLRSTNIISAPDGFYRAGADLRSTIP